MDVDEAQARTAELTATRDGRTHFFCSAPCKASFLAKPITAGVATQAPGHP